MTGLCLGSGVALVGLFSRGERGAHIGTKTAMAPKKRQRASPAASASAGTPAEVLTVKATDTSADSLREALTKMWRSDTLCDVEIKIEGRHENPNRANVGQIKPSPFCGFWPTLSPKKSETRRFLLSVPPRATIFWGRLPFGVFMVGYIHALDICSRAGSSR